MNKTNNITVAAAKQLIDEEYNSDGGLDVLFRMSADVDAARIAKFIDALHSLDAHYAGKEFIERKLVYYLTSMSKTLKASMSHWKVSHPEGLDNDTCFKIIKSIENIFMD